MRSDSVAFKRLAAIIRERNTLRAEVRFQRRLLQRTADLLLDWAKRMRFTRVLVGMLVIFLVGCGSPGGRCVDSGLPIETDEGVSASCEDIAGQLQALRVLFVRQFGQVPLTGFSVHVVAADTVYEDGAGKHAAWTNWSYRSYPYDYVPNGGTVTISQHFIHQLFAHELLHVQLGPQSAQHVEPEWCLGLSPWEIQQGLQDERAYLGCPQ